MVASTNALSNSECFSETFFFFSQQRKPMDFPELTRPPGLDAQDSDP
jgi:hypothetical protein